MATRARHRCVSGLLVAAATACWCGPLAGAENRSEESAADARLNRTVQFLASDELEGRGLGTKGIDAAAENIAEQFRVLGLKTELFDGAPFQKFTVAVKTELGPAERNTLAFSAPPEQPDEQRRIEFKLGTDFSPLAVGGSGELDAPLVFAGYGITAPKLGYDDYANIDAKGKIVVVLRHEPQQADPKSVFDGTADSEYAPIARKVSNAFEHGATAVLLVTDEAELEQRRRDYQDRLQQAVDELAKANEEFKKLENPTAEQIESHRKELERLGEQIRKRAEAAGADLDTVFSFRRAGDASSGRTIPVIHVRRSVIEPAIQGPLKKDLAAIERQIDQDLKPASADLPGWQAVGEVRIERVEATVKNVIGILPGEGPLANQAIVIGAHYDHLGRGDSNSLAPGSGEIHNGADDNASGVAAMLEIARQLATREKKLPRTVVFIAFTGEERGLLGSAQYVRDPVVPLDDTIAMLNLDMVGRLRDDKLVVYGVGTAGQWESLLNGLNEKYAFKLTRHPEGFGPSDQSSFYAKKIPVLHFFTGTHADYHKPSDDADKINVEGMRRIADMVAEAAVQLAEADGRPEYVEVQGRGQFAPAGDRPYFGSIPDFSQDHPGYALMGVSKGGPAEKAGIKAGDIIIQFGASRIGNLEDFDSALRKHSAGDRVPVVVHRGKEELRFEVTLEAAR